MIFNIGDKKTRMILSLAKTPLLFYPHYKYHLPLPTVLMIENTNHCNAECVMCPRDTLSRECGFMDFGLFEKIVKEVSSAKRKPIIHLHGFGEPLLDRLLAERIHLAKICGIKRTYIVTNASLLFPETSRKIISAGLDKMKVIFYGTDEVSYSNTMKRLHFKASFQNIKDFFGIRKELKKKNPQVILQYLPNDTNNAKTVEFRSLWKPLIDPNIGDYLDVISLHNYGGGKAYQCLGREIVSVCYFPWTSLSVLWNGRVIPVVWILMVFRFWEISIPRVFRRCGMDRCYPRSETTLESSTTVSTQSASRAIGHIGVRMPPDQSAVRDALPW